MKTGFVGIGTVGGKFNKNLGSIIRSASVFNADFVFSIGGRYSSSNTAVGHDRHIPIFSFPDFRTFCDCIPQDATLVRADVDAVSSLSDFEHPDKVIYLMGAEDYGFNEEVKSESVGVRIETDFCLNQAVTAGIFLYDRQAKSVGEKDILPTDFVYTSADN